MSYENCTSLQNLLTKLEKYGIFKKIHQEFCRNKGVIVLIDEKICKLRDELNKSIQNGEDYDIIYKLSVKLDSLIAEYYKNVELM